MIRSNSGVRDESWALIYDLTQGAVNFWRFGLRGELEWQFLLAFPQVEFY